jgi:hypothetical protein
MGITVRQMTKYLSEYSDDAGIGTVVVDTKNRKKYEIKDGNWLDMFSYPVLVLDVGEACDMDKAEKAVACECEEPEIVWNNSRSVSWKCKNCGGRKTIAKVNDYKERMRYCQRCGQRFNWEGVTLDEA